VHFDLGSTPAAAGGSPGPSGQQWEAYDPFLTSTGPEPSQEVSISYNNFTIYCLTDLIQGAFQPPQTESFDQQVGPRLDDSPEGHASGPVTPSRRRQRRAQHVSIHYINFTIYCLTDLIQRAFSPPQAESFDLQVSPELDGSPEGHTSDPATPTRLSKRAQKKAQKAGSRLAANKGDDVFGFFEEKGEHRYCTLCE